MGAGTKAWLRLRRWGIQAVDAIDVARWQFERQWAHLRRKPWPPPAHLSPGAVPRRRPRALPLPAAVTPARGVSVAALLVAVLSVGALLQEPDGRGANARGAKVGPLLDSLRPEASAQAAPNTNGSATRKDDAVRHTTREPQRSATSRGESKKARSRKKERESRASGRSKRERVASRVGGGGGGDRQATGRSPAAQSPAASSPAPPAQQPAAPEPAAPAPVTAAPAPAAPPQEPTRSGDAGGETRAHPHGGPPGHSEGRAGGKGDK